ncbi:MAG: hypothetical protein WBM86_20455 [Waterburya sp.]
MSQAHIPDTENYKKALEATEQASKRDLRTTYATTYAVALLVKKLIGLVMRGGNALLNRDRDKTQDSSWLDNAGDLLRGGGKKRVGKNVIQRSGNKIRGLLRGGKLKTAARIGRNANKAGRFAKTARFARTAGTVARTAKMAKTAHTAYKVGKVAKLANVGRIVLTGGTALAGGPVGVALLVGSVVAPIAIEKIWKNREQIYNGGKNLIDKSKLAAKDINAIVRGKNAQVGEVVPDAENLKIEGDDKSVLLETDAKGKVVTNNFDPNQKLAFYQQQQGESTMLLDEADIYPAQQADDLNQTAQTVPEQQDVESTPNLEKNNPGKIGGIAVIQGNLRELRQNNPNDNVIQTQSRFLERGLDEAQSAQQEAGPNNLPQTPGLRQSIQINEAGSAIINLFNSQQPPGKRNQPLETEDYRISRRGNDYFLKDKEGKLLLQTTNTSFGTKIKDSNLSQDQLVDLAYLKQDLRLGEGITGGFVPVKSLAEKQVPQAEPNNIQTPQQSMNKPSQRSAFSQYIEEDKVPVTTGNTKQKSSEMER